MSTNDQERENLSGAIAIIGMSGRFPKAANIEEFWDNLCHGIEGIDFLTEAEDFMSRKNHDIRNDSSYIPAGGFLDGIEQFDASFFGYTAREAQIMDPQQRIFLEEAWTALERAGYDTKQYKGRIGIIAGTGMNQYFLKHVYQNLQVISVVGSFQAMLNNEKDYLASRVAYKLGCTGASFTIQTACSTSLTAVAIACQSLLSYQNDMVLAGGVSLPALEKSGYFFEKGGIASPDGHCRPYDAEAQGTVPGNGVGIVVLKRAEEALADGDYIYAFIRSVAMNNDGGEKMGFTAPRVDGQAEVIAEAIALADVGAESIGYVEGHGTGTRLGDPIEITALTKAFRMYTDKTGFCALGSVKSNLGHLDTAAGVTGLIKATLVLKNKVIPPTLHFQKPNPEMDLETSPFYVNSKLVSWPKGICPRRAGVSSFGIGGTNVHAILEEVSVYHESGGSRSYQLILLSAQTPSALEKLTGNLIKALNSQASLNLADVAYTLHVGRRVFPYRRIVVAETIMELTDNLAGNCGSTSGAAVMPWEAPVFPVFLFPGQGVQYLNMGRQLYEQESVYRRWVDYCSEKLIPLLSCDLRYLMYPLAGEPPENEEQLRQTQIAQPAIFVTEYAIARLLMEWGIKPKAMIGHSLGELVVATIAEVFSLEDALTLVAERSRLMQSMPSGEMISVTIDESQARKWSNQDISIAAVNAPSICVLSGPKEAIAELELKLGREGIEYRRLHTSHAFHSRMMDPVKQAFENVLRDVALSPPKIPYVSSMTGTWITDEEATSLVYWGKQLREPVYFAAGVQRLLQETNGIPVEVGPGHTLSVFVKQQPSLKNAVIPTMHHPQTKQEDCRVLMNSIGRLWLNGIAVNARDLYKGQDRQRVLLPTYPFERKWFWLEAVNWPELRKNQHQSIIDDNDEEEGQVAINQDIVRFQGSLYLTETEAKVAGIWSEMLGETAITASDDFFELGGHSLLGIRLMKRIREMFQIELPESTLYNFSTVESLSEAIDKTLLNQRGLSQVSRVDRSLPIPASWTQTRMWKRERIYPKDCCTTATGWEYRGKLDIPLLERCIKELIARHEALRMSFQEYKGQLYQIIHDSLEFKLPVVDARDLSEEEQEQEIHSRAFCEEWRPFDMNTPPLWRLNLYLCSGDRYAFFITAHASIMDGPSANIFLRELGSLLQLREQETAQPIAPLRFQLVDLTQWERTVWSGPRYDEYLSYWSEKLRNIRITRLPTDKPRKSCGSLSAVVSFILAKKLADQLKKIAQAQNCSFYTVLLAGFKIVTHMITGETDLLTETSVANRTNPESEGVIGCFVNFFFLRVSLENNPSFIEVIQRVKDTVRGALTHSELPFAKIMSEMYPQLFINERHFVQGVAFTQYEKGTPITWPGLTTERRLWARRALFDLYVSVVDEGDEGVVFNAEYDTYHFQHSTIQNWFSKYIWILEQMVGDLNTCLNDLVTISRIIA